MNAAHELEDIVSTTRLLVTRLRADRARRRRDVSAFELDDYGETVVSLEYTVLRLVSSILSGAIETYKPGRWTRPLLWVRANES